MSFKQKLVYFCLCINGALVLTKNKSEKGMPCSRLGWENRQQYPLL
jgi:hypothetical protein